MKNILLITCIIAGITLTSCEKDSTSNTLKLPICEIITPINNDLVGIGENIKIEIESWGQSSRRTIEVYLYLDNAEISYLTEKPFIQYFEPYSLSPGEHTIKAIAYDDIGNVNEDNIHFKVVETLGETESFINFDNGLPSTWYSSGWNYDATLGIQNSGVVKSKNDNCVLITTKSYSNPGNINFRVKNIDGKLELYDNGKLKAKWFEQGGDWAKYSYSVIPGTHTFRWKCTSPEIYIDNVNFVEDEVDHTLGEYYGGGVIFYLDSTKLHGLISAEYDLGIATWGCHLNDLSTGNKASSQFDGMANTLSIVTDCSELSCAARLCYDYEVIEGDSIYNDWYLPAPEQLNILYAVKDVVGNFKTKMYEELYWTSYSWYWGPETFGYEVSGSISFEDGQGHGAITILELNVRAIRSF